MRLRYDDIIDIFDLKYMPSEDIGYSLNPGIYELTDINKTLEYLSPNNMKVSITIEDIRLKSSLKLNQTLIFTKKSFFHTILGFIQSQSGVLGDIEGLIQTIRDTYTSDNPIKFTKIVKILSKYDCINACIFNGIRESILFSFSLSPPPVINYTKN